MKNSRGVVSLRRWALFAALATACVTPSEPTAAQSQSLLGGCAKDSQCEDGNPCTQNPCALGLCAPALPVLGCCHEGACVDSDADGAVAPILELPPSGCSQHEDCEDDHPCTQNLCVMGVCASLPVLGCSPDDGSGGVGAAAGAPSGGSTGGEGGADSGGVEPSTAGRSAHGGRASPSEGGASAPGVAPPDSGAPSAEATADYQLQGGGCTVSPKPLPVFATAWLGALAAAAWCRKRRWMR